MSKGKADFVTTCITSLLVMILCLCWKINRDATLYFVYLLAALGLIQFIQGTERFLMEPGKETKDVDKRP